MSETLEVGAVVRRFLQARRRGPFELRELTRLLHTDATYVEVIDGERLTVSGGNGIAELLQAVWARRGDDETMSIVRSGVTSDTTAVGHWRRVTADGTVVHGRDRYTVADGLIVEIEVEEFASAAVPTYVRI